MNEYGIHSVPWLAEPISSTMHLLGAFVFALLAIPLLRKAATRNPQDSRNERLVRLAATGIFAASVVLLLATSGLYHLLPFESPRRAFLLQLDYAAIFVLIAGTFTPAIAILYRGWRRRGALLLVWSAAVAGITIKTLFPSLVSAMLGVYIYLGLGWIGVFGAASLWRRHGPTFVEPLILGGAAYTAGAAVQLACRPEIVPGVIGPHELLHAAVLLGIAFHWYFIYQFADGQVQTGSRAGSSDEPDMRLSASTQEAA